jgi:molybdopterin-guanine dinucleotide biosynthesis protein A
LVTHGSRLAAAILAGGTARRMGGRQKALLDVGGRPILDRQLDALRQVADPIFIVGSDAPAWLERGLEAVADEIPGCGALGGIYTAIVRSPRERTIVIACDMPYVSLPLLRHMASLNADIVIPRSGRGLEPLCAIYARSCAGAIRQRLERGELEAAKLPEGLRVEEIGAGALEAFGPDGRLFVNVNTPHDYERARTMVEPSSRARQDRIMDGED